MALVTAEAAVLPGRMLDLSRRKMDNIRQNVTIALGLKAYFW